VRHQVLTETRRGAEEVRVVCGKRYQLRHKDGRERMFILGPIDA
jgi:hypothetical protein